MHGMASPCTAAMTGHLHRSKQLRQSCRAKMPRRMSARMLPGQGPAVPALLLPLPLAFLPLTLLLLGVAEVKPLPNWVVRYPTSMPAQKWRPCPHTTTCNRCEGKQSAVSAKCVHLRTWFTPADRGNHWRACCCRSHRLHGHVTAWARHCSRWSASVVLTPDLHHAPWIQSVRSERSLADACTANLQSLNH